MNIQTGYCYIVLFSNGFVKGGKSRDVFKRYKTHKATAAALGLSVKSAFYTGPHGDYHASEKRLLSALAEASEHRVGEFFRGVEAAAALEALDSLGYGLNAIEDYYDGRGLILAQEALLKLATNSANMTLSDLRVFHCLLAHVDHENFVLTSQAEMAEKIGMAKSHFNRSLKRLFEEGIFEKGPKVGRMVSIKFNPEFGWKGSAKNHVIALDKERRRRMRKAGISGVVDGGRDGENIQTPEDENPPPPSSAD